MRGLFYKAEPVKKSEMAIFRKLEELIKLPKQSAVGHTGAGARWVVKHPRTALLPSLTQLFGLSCPLWLTGVFQLDASNHTCACTYCT